MALKRDQQLAARQLLALESRIEREIISNYTNALRAVTKELKAIYKKYGVAGELTHAEMTKYNRLAAMQRQLAKILEPYSARNVELIRMLTESQYEAAFYRRAWAFDNNLRTSLGWGQIPQSQVRGAVWNRYNRGALRHLTASSRSRLQTAVTQGLIRGVSLPRMAGHISDAMGVTTRYAMLIARTEAHRARELGNLAASDQAADWGVEVWRVWDAALDTRTRSTHAALDGVRRRPGASFPGGALYPGGFGVASEDINCRCTVTDEIEGYEPRNRRTEQGTQPYVTFGDWARERGITGSRYGQAYNFL